MGLRERQWAFPDPPCQLCLQWLLGSSDAPLWHLQAHNADTVGTLLSRDWGLMQHYTNWGMQHYTGVMLSMV